MLIDRLLKFEGDPAGGGDPPPTDPPPKPAPEGVKDLPPEPPKYVPPGKEVNWDDVSIIDKQVEYYRRNTEAGGKDLEELITKLHTAGVLDTGSDPGDTERVANLETTIAKERAARIYNLTDEDMKMLNGTPDEIMAGAKYLAERLAGAAPPENPPPPDGGVAPGKPPEQKPSAPALEKYATRSADPQKAVAEAQATMDEAIARGEKFGSTGAG